MKKMGIKVLLALVLSISIQLQAQNGAFRVRNVSTGAPAVQVGYDDYRYLSFGKSSSTPNNGAWAIENWDGGLNFWKPWPTTNNGNYKMFIHDQGFVGINGKPDPGRVRSCGFLGMSTCSNFRLQVFGNAIANDWYTYSDSSLKENVVNIQNVLPSILKMKPIEYSYKAIKLIANTSTEAEIKEGMNTENTPTTDPKRRYGFTVQEVSRIFPNLAEEFNENVGVVNYVGFVPLLVKGMQEQQTIIESLKQEIADLKGKTVYTDVDKTKLFQNDPNPYRGSTNFTYFIDENVAVSNAIIEIRNIMGVLQSSITLGDRSGLGKVSFDSNGLTDGYYIYTLKINGSIKDSKMMLVGE
jgi:hypothetical protein